MDMKVKAEPFPVLLNTSDAMLFAAEQLDKLTKDIELVALLAPILLAAEASSCPTGEEEGRKAHAALRLMSGSIVDKEVQVTAMQAAAKEIRAAAHETKLAEARAAQRGIKA